MFNLLDSKDPNFETAVRAAILAVAADGQPLQLLFSGEVHGYHCTKLAVNFIPRDWVLPENCEMPAKGVESIQHIKPLDGVFQPVGEEPRKAIDAALAAVLKKHNWQQ